MTALAALTTALVDALHTQTDIPAGNATAPIVGEPVRADYPYFVVDQISDVELPELIGPASTLEVTYQIRAVGITRDQAAHARDRARIVLDPTIVVTSGVAEWSGARWIDLSTFDVEDGGMLHSGLLRISVIVVASDPVVITPGPMTAASSFGTPIV